jgi:hypothetical protein
MERKTQCDKLLDLLKDGAWHPFMELNAICYRYGARLYDLKQRGYDHEVMTIRKIKYYKLKQEN